MPNPNPSFTSNKPTHYLLDYGKARTPINYRVSYKIIIQIKTNSLHDILISVMHNAMNFGRLCSVFDVKSESIFIIL